ncbi:hypothetical protein J3R82DRAFT_3445 [Butyriboletus roseoflavus]|nr:hypothetical protein J3R82DRAFT_3444 [Butyriboletus roseoflavus]KAG8220350.1 hypothetical protein J3R82DRAFT_3445 [Butyriboletus roseoflavus]
MDLKEMASIIMEMFDQGGKWACETVDWWNSRAFPKAVIKEDPNSEDDVAMICAQRAGCVHQPKCQIHPRSHAAKQIEFESSQSPPPEDSNSHSGDGSSATTMHPSMASSSSLSLPSMSDTSASASAPTTPYDKESDLSSVPSDNEHTQITQVPRTLWAAITIDKTLNVGASTTVTTAMLRDATGSVATSTAGPAKSKRKSATSNKKTRVRKNGF